MTRFRKFSDLAEGVGFVEELALYKLKLVPDGYNSAICQTVRNKFEAVLGNNDWKI